MTQTRRLAAVMFTDIVGYTALMAKDELNALALLQRNKVVHKQRVIQYNGEVLKEIGDGTLCCFPSALDAVHCAIAIQKQVAQEPELRLRIGIHLGDLVFSKGDVFGDGVNVASRIQHAADPGRICISEQIYLQVRNHLDVSAVLIGAKTFKNVEGQITIYTVESSADGQRRSVRNAAWKGTASRILLWTIPTAIVLVALVLWIVSTQNGSMRISVGRAVPLTSAPGLEEDPTWSPEGSRVAYASDEAGNMDIWIRQIAAGQTVNLTGAYEGYDGKPAWSPDGEWIAFVSERNGGGLFVVPALGGTPRLVTSLTFARSRTRAGTLPDIAWSPDSEELAYTLAGSLYTIPAVGGTPEAIPLPSSGLIVGYLDPSWSPDGERIVCTGLLGPGIATSQIWSLDRSGAAPIPVTKGAYMDQSPIWAPDAKAVFFVSDRDGMRDVWWIPVDREGKPRGEPEAITAGAGVGAIAVSSDIARLVYTKGEDRSNIWSFPLSLEKTLGISDAQPITSGNDYVEIVDVTADGERIAFDSNRRGNVDIWILDKTGGSLRQLTTNQAHDWFPSWSPDGTEVLFHSMLHGNRDIFVMPLHGGPQRRLTDHPAEDLAAEWSPDGTRIAFGSNRSGNLDIWLMNSDGSDLRQLTRDSGQEIVLVWSPDGTEIVFASNRTGHYELFRLSPDQQPESDEIDGAVQLTDGGWEIVVPLHWLSDGRTILIYGVGGPDERGANIWAVSAADGTARPVLDLEDTPMEPSHSLSVGGERIFIPLVERTGDLWMVELLEGR